MKAAVLHGQGDIRYEDIETPRIAEDEILVRVKATGICGSDIPRVLGTAARYYPIVLGHEFSGEVVEVGANVTTVRVGDRIAGAPLIPCHECTDCLRGDYAQCRSYTFVGSRIFGSFAEYVKIPARNAIRLSDDVSYEQGAFFEPLTVGLHGLSVMQFRGGTDVGILGAGTIGLLTLQCAKLLGAKRIFAFDVDEKRLEVARDYGADLCLNARDPDFRDAVWDATKGRGLPMVVETAGVEFTEKLSLELAANKGNVMFIGTPSTDITLTPREFEHINRKELTIRGSWMSYSAPFPGEEWELAEHYFNKGLIRIRELIDRVISLSEVAKAFEDLAVPGKVRGKILIEV